MAYFDKLARLIKLAGILGLSLASVVISACGGRSPSGGNNNHALPDGAFAEAGVDASVDGGPQRDSSVDAARIDADTQRDGQPPDAQLWDVICE